MKNQPIEINGALRESVGKKDTRALRREGGVPCVIYGGEQNVSFSADGNDLKKIVYTDQFLTANINVGDKTYWAFIKEIQFHPVTDAVSHVDFQELVADKKVLCEIPIRLEGFAKGVQAGGVIMKKMRTLRLKGVPSSIPDEITLDVTDLELGSSIKVKDVQLADDAEIMNPLAIPIASIVVPRALRGKDEAEEGAEGEAEGEEAAAAEA